MIAVLGVNGAQGSAVASALLDDGTFSVRCLARHCDTDMCKRLTDQGAELFRADVHDPASLRAALEGCHGVYLVTFYWEHMDAKKEEEEVLNVAKAAKEAGVQHVVMSTLQDTRSPQFKAFHDSVPPVSRAPSDMRVPHFDSKGGSERHLKGFPTVSFVVPGGYWDNLFRFGLLMRNDQTGGRLALGTNMDFYPGLALEDLGKAVVQLFKKGTDANAERVLVYSELKTRKEMITELSEVLGDEVVDGYISRDDFAKFASEGTADMANMFELYNSDEFRKMASASRGKLLEYVSEPTTFRSWAEAHRKELRLK